MLSAGKASYNAYNMKKKKNDAGAWRIKFLR